MHTDLIVAMTRKGTDLVRTHRFTPENLPELSYPLERARAYAARAERQGGANPPGSLGAFVALLAAYERFYGVVDGLRGGWGGTSHAALRDAVREVRRRAAAVERALATEGR
jgi:hypothetical protein